ncbi:phage tail fiber repeat family protein [Escherichia coli 6-537-08_S3_C1]|uniref:phage tail fiber protein n=1 Tax=Escherichia coli TaxID=562 RepID=UPI0004D7EE31|nr:phage tail fiber repeat family protein [Escherichia coli 6-537-08_S3_C1]
MALEDASTTKKGIVQLSSATNSTSETLAATPKAVKSAYDNAEKRLQKDQNGADIPDKGRFLNNINAVSKTDFADKRGMRYVRVNAPAGATSGKYYPVVVMRSAGSVSELASRVIITTATRTAGDPMNNCEFNGFVMPGGWTDRGRYAYGMFWQYQNNERAIHSIMMSNKGDDLRSVFYVDGAAFPVFAFIEDGLSISAPGADLVVNDTTYKFGATNPATECIAADVILDFKSGRGFYESNSLIVNDNLSCKKLFATDEIVARGGNQIRMIGGEYGALWRNDGAKTHLLLTNQGDVYGGWNTLRPFSIDNATGELVIGTKLSASLNGNALTATKLQTPRRVSGVEFDGSKDITLTAAHVAAFARRATGSYADADGGVPWNAESGAYNVVRTGESYILANFYTGVGSCRTLQIKAHYKNGGLFYRSSRDGYGFESGWEQVYTTGFMPQPADINAPTAAAGWLNSGNGTAFTTAQFITWLNNQGAFSNKYWIARCSWAYANNNYIDDTGCGRIDLSGSVIEVFSNKSKSHYTIRVTTTTTSGHGGVNNAEFIYVYNGSDYAPGWRRSYNTRNKPTASDVGALSLSGGALTGGLTAAGEIISKSANGLRIAYGNYGFFIRNDGSNTYFMLTASGDTLGSWNGLRPIIINNTSGAVTIGNGLNVTGGINGSLNGNAATATKLQTARTIGGVSFDGSANINLPGVNIAGNQNTTGNAATATKLQTARTINGVSFDGSKNIELTPRSIGTINSATMSFSGGAGWFKLATVTMPQASSVVYISLIGGAGFNVGSPQQAGISELVLRAGNGNPKGITGALWRRTSVGFTNFAWVNTSGDTYDIYVEIGNYATGVNIQWDYTSNASVTIHTSPTYTANKPTGLTDGTVYVIYSSHIKPTAADVGALSLSGGQLNGALGIGTSSALGGNSIVLGDNDTGFKQNGDGILDVYANSAHVFRFVNSTLQSLKPLSVTGDITSSAWVYANRFSINSGSGAWIDMRNQNVIFGRNAVSTSSAQALLRQDHADRKFFLGGLGNSQFGFYMINNSRTANGTDANAYLQNDGTWVCGGNGSFNDVYIRSDRRSKRNIRKIERALDKLDRIEGVLYEIQVCDRYEQSGGLIAQDVQNVQPELVTVDHNDQSGEPRLRLNYNGVIGMLVEAVKELREEVRELKAKM